MRKGNFYWEEVEGKYYRFLYTSAKIYCRKISKSIKQNWDQVHFIVNIASKDY